MVAVVVAMAMISCVSKGSPDYAEYHSPADTGHWDALEQLEFNPHIAGADSISAESYALLLDLRHTSSLRMRNLFLEVSYESGGAAIGCDTVKIALFDDDGNRLSSKNYGLFRASTLLKRNLHLPRSYKVSVRPVVSGGVSGVSSVGIQLLREAASQSSFQK